MNAANATINCSAYELGTKRSEITIGDIGNVLNRSNSFVWLGLFEPDSKLLSSVQKEFDLHDLAIEDAQKAHQQPKIEEYGDTLFVVLRTVRLSECRIMHGETHFFVGPKFFISVRHGDSDGYAVVRRRAEQATQKLASGPGYVLYLVIDFIVDHYQPCVDHLQNQFHAIEEQLFKNSPPTSNLVEDFYRLKNELLKLHAAAYPLTDICNQLLRFHSELIPKENRIYYRDILDHVARVTQTADRLQEMINAAMQVSLAQITIRQNEVVKKLAGWGAILAIPTMVFSMYGMNFKNIPELDWYWGYPVIVLITLGCAFVLWLKLRKARWL